MAVNESATGAVAEAQAATVDASVAASEQAALAAQAAIAASASAAANAEAAATERTAHLEAAVGAEVVKQNDQIAGLTDHMQRVSEWQTQTHSHLQTITERQEKTETVLSSLVALLTPKPPSETTTTTNPDKLPDESAEGQKDQPTNQTPARPKHRWI